MLPRGKSNTSNYTHYAELEKRGEFVPELIAYRQAKTPISLRNYWQAFLDMHSRRRYYDGSPDTISFSDIIAYGQCRGRACSPVETKVILACDDAFLNVYWRLKRNESRQSSDKPSPSSRRR